MKFAVSLEQRDYFHKNGFIHFSALLNASELSDLNEGIELIRTEKKTSPPTRDLWRMHEKIKKISWSRRLVELAYELLQKKPLRLAFDQLLLEHSLYEKEEDNEFFSESGSFQEHSCISGLQGLFLFCIKTFPGTLGSNFEAGSGYFLLPSSLFPFTSLTPSAYSRFFLIGYGDAYSQYLYEIKDPYLHFLKSLGYVFGEKLNDRLHPILLR